MRVNFGLNTNLRRDEIMISLHRIIFLSLILALLIVFQNGCSVPAQSNSDSRTVNNSTPAPRVLTEQGELELEGLSPLLLQRRVVYIGETHDRYDHHLNQLALIRALHQADPNMAIGLEMFQQPYQAYLDAFVAGKIDERAMLEKTEYFQRWGYDYRLYRPIIQYAREHGIPVIALNVPKEISRRVAEVGLDGLTVEERSWVPAQIDKSDDTYRERLRQVFAAHEGMSDAHFEQFVEVQLLWDETMAERAADYLRANPDSRLVVVAGNGHLAYGSGIPQRLQRRLPTASAAIVLQGDEDGASSQGEDYLVVSEKIRLPPSGRLGIMLQPAAAGMTVKHVTPESGAQQAGIKNDDRIVIIADQSIETMDDVRLALLDKDPGESVQVTIERADQGGTAQELDVNVTLQQ